MSCSALWHRLMFNLATITQFISKHNLDAVLEIIDFVQPVVRELNVQRLSGVAVLKVRVHSQTDCFIVDLNQNQIKQS